MTLPAMHHERLAIAVATIRDKPRQTIQAAVERLYAAHPGLTRKEAAAVLSRQLGRRVPAATVSACAMRAGLSRISEGRPPRERTERLSTLREMARRIEHLEARVAELEGRS
jgi:hypothetical protein